MFSVKNTLPLRLKGRVVHGKKIGSTQLGIPTANIEQTEVVCEKIAGILNGVYSGRVLLKGAEYPAAISVGFNPTFGNIERSVVKACLIVRKFIFCMTSIVCSMKKS